MIIVFSDETNEDRAEKIESAGVAGDLGFNVGHGIKYLFLPCKSF